MNHLLVGTKFRNTNTPPGFDYEPWTMETLMAQGLDATDDSGDWE